MQRVINVKGAGASGVASPGKNDKARIHNVSFTNMEVAFSAPTFLELYEVPYRGASDWTLHRGGAIFIEGAVNAAVTNCTIHSVGGNAVYLSHDVRNTEVRSNVIGQVKTNKN